MPIAPNNPFKGRQHPGEVIILCVRWYLRYSAELSAIGTDDGRAELKRRSRHDLAVGPAVCAGAEPPVPTGTSEDQPVVASRRDVLSGGRQVDLIYIERWIPPARQSTFS